MPRRVVLRVYIAAAGDSWVVMPGGVDPGFPVARFPHRLHAARRRQQGHLGAFASSGRPFTMRRPRDLPVELHRGVSSDLPSRAAEHLFWLGRYAERCEHLARVLRCILVRMTGESWAPETAGWRSLMQLYECLDSPIRAWRRTIRKASSTRRRSGKRDTLAHL